MLTYSLKDKNEPLYRALYNAIKDDIVSLRLQRGMKLPSKRAMAENNCVSIITVENAYSLLLSEGYIYSKPRSGFFVSDIKYRADTKKDVENALKINEENKSPSYIADFSSSQTPSDLFPFDDWLKCAKKVFRSEKSSLLDNPPSMGCSILRGAIKNYLKNIRGLECDEKNIVIGAGSEYLYQILAILIGEEHRYAIEEPGYRKMEYMYRAQSLDVDFISINDGGIKKEELERKNIDILHITPSHQYPTGIVMPVSKRYELLSWASEKSGRYIIEDDYDSELRLDGRPISSLKAIDTEGNVIYINTFSKALASTIRISYMVLPPALGEKYRKKLFFLSSPVSTFEQYTLSEFISSAKMESHINRIRTYYRKKRDTLIKALQESYIGKKIEIKGENAGLHFLMKVKTEKSEEEVIKKGEEEEIKLLPLSSFYHDISRMKNEDRNTYVMNYASLDMSALDCIINKLEGIFS